MPEEIDTDLDGNPRILDVPEMPDTGSGHPPIVDMGAYESLGEGCLALVTKEVIAGPISEGAFPFNTILATTDGLATTCSGGPGATFVKDIWFRYTPTCSGTATFDTCNDADFDTRPAVYLDTGMCPPAVLFACCDNAAVETADPAPFGRR